MKQKVIRKPPSLLLVLLSKSSKSLDHMLWKEYTVYSEWHLTAFLTTGIDPSHSFRMTLYHSQSFWTETRMLCGKDGKIDMWHRVKNLWLGWHLSRILPDTFVLLPFKFMHANRKPRHMKKDTYICKCLFLYQQLPILPGRFRPSTFGVCELNFRVRHGYGWSSQLSPLFLWEPVLSKPYRRSPEVIRLSRCF